MQLRIVEKATSSYTVVVFEPSKALRNAADELVYFFKKATGITLDVIPLASVSYEKNSKYIVLGNGSLVESVIGKYCFSTQEYKVVCDGDNILIAGDDWGVLYGVYAFLHYTFGYETYGVDECYIDEGVTEKILAPFTLSDKPDILYRFGNYHPVMYYEGQMSEAKVREVSLLAQRMRFFTELTTFAGWFHNSLDYFREQDSCEIKNCVCGGKTHLDGHEKWYASNAFGASCCVNIAGEKVYRKIGTDKWFTISKENGIERAVDYTDTDAVATQRKKRALNQLCYNAHGDADELEKMQDRMLTHAKRLITKRFDAGVYVETLLFEQTDGGGWCQCEACRADRKKYGTDAAAIIRFINPVADKLKEWMANRYPNRPMTIVFFAYTATVNAPVKEDGKGGWEPLDESVRPRDNVGVMYAPIEANFFYDFDSEKYGSEKHSNAYYLQMIKKWGALSDKLYLWTYGGNFIHRLSWFDSFEPMKKVYKYAKENNAVFMFNEGGGTKVLSRFDSLKMYLHAKLSWKTDMSEREYDEILNDFFKHWFKEAAEPMKRYFDAFLSASAERKKEYAVPGHYQKKYNGYIYACHNHDAFTEQEYAEWGGYINEALRLAENPLVRKRIKAEGLAIEYNRLLTYCDVHVGDDENNYLHFDSKEMLETHKAKRDELFVNLKELFGEELKIAEDGIWNDKILAWLDGTSDKEVKS
ncbi:MAG: DUF4838 domain-containing protein [Clostridia bacterium]|nr:DUF4838 domain-containing protein [Clostridia bacterium]